MASEVRARAPRPRNHQLEALTAETITNLNPLTPLPILRLFRPAGTLDALANCKSLTSVDVSFCGGLGGPLPGVVIKLISEGKANLDGCQGPFTIGDDLSAIADIKKIDLSSLGSRLQGSLDPLANCTKLEKLSLFNCQSLTGTLDALANCKNLTSVNCYNCSFTGPCPRPAVSKRSRNR
jgi:hypothetical protein